MAMLSRSSARGRRSRTDLVPLESSPVVEQVRCRPGDADASTLDAMRVEVNADLCQGHNRCYALAPELFDVDDYGTAIVIGDGSVSPDLEDKARLAVANCPEYAITITEDA